MPRRNNNVRTIKRRGIVLKVKPTVRLCCMTDDGIRPGCIVAAAEYVGHGHYQWRKVG